MYQSIFNLLHMMSKMQIQMKNESKQGFQLVLHPLQLYSLYYLLDLPQVLHQVRTASHLYMAFGIDLVTIGNYLPSLMRRKQPILRKSLQSIGGGRTIASLQLMVLFQQVGGFTEFEGGVFREKAFLFIGIGEDEYVGLFDEGVEFLCSVGDLMYEVDVGQVIVIVMLLEGEWSYLVVGDVGDVVLGLYFQLISIVLCYGLVYLLTNSIHLPHILSSLTQPIIVLTMDTLVLILNILQQILVLLVNQKDKRLKGSSDLLLLLVMLNTNLVQALPVDLFFGLLLSDVPQQAVHILVELLVQALGGFLEGVDLVGFVGAVEGALGAYQLVALHAEVNDLFVLVDLAVVRLCFQHLFRAISMSIMVDYLFFPHQKVRKLHMLKYLLHVLH